MADGLPARLSDLPLLRDDKKFILAALAVLPPAWRNRCAEVYREVWLSAVDREPEAIRKENRGRLAANRWLREILENRGLFDRAWSRYRRTARS